MNARRISFEQALNDAIRAGAGETAPVGPVAVPRHLGTPAVKLDRALQLAGELEDEEIIR